jgi:hypothetical protein
MTDNPEGLSYSAVVLINNSSLHLSDYGQIHECREKEFDDQVRE